MFMELDRVTGFQDSPVVSESDQVNLSHVVDLDIDNLSEGVDDDDD